jgi:hypothetical protein
VELVRRGFVASVVLPIAAWLLYDGIRVRRGLSSTSSDLRAYAQRHPWRCIGALVYFCAHVIGELLLPAWLCRRDPLAWVATRIAPRPVVLNDQRRIVVSGPQETSAALKRVLDEDTAKTLQQIRRLTA